MASAFPPRVRWCLLLAAPLAWPDVDELGGYALAGVHRARGGDELREAARVELGRDGIATRDELLAWLRARLHGDGERGWELGRAIHVVGRAYWAELIGESDAIEISLVAGKLAQRAHASWGEYAASFRRGADAAVAELSDGRATRDGGIEEKIAALLAPHGAWHELAWDLPLGVAVLAMTCPACGRVRTTPSPSAWIYCEACGSLVGYDVSVAVAGGAARPGPAFEAVRAERATALGMAKAHGDMQAYDQIQHELFDAWIDASPLAAPPGVAEPNFRERYVDQLARIETFAAFDSRASELAAAMETATKQLAFVDVGGRPRVPAEQFRPFADAVLALLARRDELCVEHDLYALNPDGASRDVQRGIALAMFAHAWLAYVDDDTAAWLVARCEP